MAAKDLITLARAKQNIQAIADNSQDALLGSLITSVSDAIEKYCRRYFVAATYDELYNGNGDRRLLLRQYPLQSVQSVRYRPVTVLKIINQDQSTNQQARVIVNNVAVVLQAVASGATSTISVNYGGYPTLALMAAQMNTLGSGTGWNAQVVGDSNDYGKWPSADLYVKPSFGDGITSQGALTARGVYAELKMHTYELAGYQFDARGWLLRAIPYTDPELLHPEDLVFPPGINNFRVQYTAGYTTIPESVQEACAEWVSELYWLTQRDPNVERSTLVGQVWNISGPNQKVIALLAPFRRHTIANGQS
jgi:Phage gp6-like head-tail connector protein